MSNETLEIPRPRASQGVQTFETLTLAATIAPIVDWLLTLAVSDMPAPVRTSTVALVVLLLSQGASLARDYFEHRRRLRNAAVGLVALLAVGCASVSPDGEVSVRGVAEAYQLRGPRIEVTEPDGTVSSCSSESPTDPCVRVYAGGWEAVTPSVEALAAIPLRAIDAAAGFFGIGRE